jgi:hypothetical protein
MILLALAAGALTAPPASLQTQIRAALNPVLIDAPSARFQWQEVRSPRAYCAHVNSRNRMGGYSGWTLFCVNTDGAPMRVFLDSASLDLASMIARENGYQVTP